ncbi:hypothetical protein NKDENANG_02382 [Candidatus Entotheonellaceae bacterium PAL068K]
MSWARLISGEERDARGVTGPQLAVVANGDGEPGVVHLRIGFRVQLPGGFQKQKNPTLPGMIR